MVLEFTELKKVWILYMEESKEDKAISLMRYAYALVTVTFEISLQDLYNKVKFELVESEGESVDVEGLG